MPEISIFKRYPETAEIDQLPVQRDWMNDTPEKHAYHCFPLTLTNGLGWGISFKEDIVFVWDGIIDTTPGHVKVIKGQKYCHGLRGNATLSFNTGFQVKTDENTTTLVMPVPNLFNEYAQCFTTLISTSFYKSELPVAWRITKPNTEITITAGTPVAAIIPISLNKIQDYEVKIYDKKRTLQEEESMKEYYAKVQEFSEQGQFSNLYRDGFPNEKHESKSIKLKTIRVDNED